MLYEPKFPDRKCPVCGERVECGVTNKLNKDTGWYDSYYSGVCDACGFIISGSNSKIFSVLTILPKILTEEEVLLRDKVMRNLTWKTIPKIKEVIIPPQTVRCYKDIKVGGTD